MTLSNQTLLYIAMAVGAVALAYMTIRDLIRKPKPEEAAAPVSPAVNNTVLPLQLQAYERLTLYVERITPQNLISRLYHSDYTATDMQLALLQSIKSEFEHNVTQQIYVSSAAWEAVTTLKDQTITVINQIAAGMPQDAPARELNRQILEVFMQAGESPSALAAQIINAEAKRIMH